MKENKVLKILFISILLFSMFGVPPSIFRIERSSLLDLVSVNNLIFKSISIFLVFLHAILFSNFKKNILKLNKISILYPLIFFKLYVLLKYLFQIQIVFGLLEFGLFLAFLYSYLQISDKLSRREIYYAIHMTSWIFIVLNLVQYFNNPKALFISDRFISITGNSNHAAVILALLILLNSTSLSLGYFKRLNTLLLVFLTPMLIFTGSKTGFIILIPFIIWNFYSSQNKIKYLFLFLFLIIISTYFENNYLFLKSDNIFERSLNFEDTRTVKWKESLLSFSENPFFGVYNLNQRPSYVENSYLACLQNYGLIGLIFFSIFIKRIYDYFVFRKNLHSSLMYLSIIGILIGAFFEAFLMSSTNFTLHVLLILIILKTKENENNTGYFFNRQI